MTSALTCTQIKTQLQVLNDSFCGDLIAGLTEVLALTIIMIPLIFLMTLFGVRVVQRFKIDVPKGPKVVAKPKTKDKGAKLLDGDTRLQSQKTGCCARKGNLKDKKVAIN